ncbi:MAG: iron-containing alcohol dehydrogenase, partial [Prevotella sp.]|nr:iron-containing alcohol dehydrogenase [Prevotella sp.]
MNNFVFYSPTEFVFGKGTESQVGALSKRYGAHNVLVVYGGQSAKKSGLLDRVVSALESEGLKVV